MGDIYGAIQLVLMLLVSVSGVGLAIGLCYLIDWIGAR